MKRKTISIISFLMILVMSLTGLSTVGYALKVKPITLQTVVLDGSDDLSIREVIPSPNTVTLKWNKYDSRFSILVYRRPAESGGQWTRIAVLKPGATSYTDKGVTVNKTYYYKIKAYYEMPSGSNYITKYVTKGQYYATVKAALNKPEFKLVSNMGKGVVLQWNARSEATGFAIYRSRVGKKDTWTRIATIKSNKAGQFIDTKVNIGETYYYCFKAYKTVGNKSYYSASSTVHKRVISGVTPPQNFQVVIKEDGIHISYDKVPGVLGYSIYRLEEGTDKWIKIAQLKSVNKLSFVDKTAEKGKTYTYTAKSYKTVNGKTTSSKSAKDVVIKYITDKPTFMFEPNEITFVEYFAEMNATFVFYNMQYDDDIRIFVNGTELTDELLNDEEALKKASENWNFFFYVDENKIFSTRMGLRIYRLGPGEGTLRFQHSKYDDVYAELKISCPELPFDTDGKKMYEYYYLAIDKIFEARDILDETLKLTDESQIDKGVEKARECLNEADNYLSESFLIVRKYQNIYANLPDELVNMDVAISDLNGCLHEPKRILAKYSPEDRNMDYLRIVSNSLSSTLKQYEE